VVGTLGHGAHMLYFCTINHGKFPFFQKAVLPPLDLLVWKTEIFRIHYTVDAGNCQSLNEKIKITIVNKFPFIGLMN
jgi:hypothetical protein